MSGAQPRTSVPRPVPGGGSPVYVTRLHVRYDASSFPEDIMFQETPDTGNFQGRYVLNHPFTGEATCDAAAEYQRRVSLRHDEEASNLARMTGWSIGDIRKKMAAR